MADLNFKSTIDRTMKVTKKYVDTLVEALDVNKQNKLTYEDDLEEYKRFTTDEAEVTAPINVGVFCSVASLNLEIGKTYNLKTLVSTEIPTNLSEDLTKNVRSNDKMLVEFTATAIKDEAARNQIEELRGKIPNTENFATKDDIGNINAILDVINGEEV